MRAKVPTSISSNYILQQTVQVISPELIQSLIKINKPKETLVISSGDSSRGNKRATTYLSDPNTGPPRPLYHSVCLPVREQPINEKKHHIGTSSSD
jgi:hypothetical protein